MSKHELEDPLSKHPSTKRSKQIDASNPYEELRELLESQNEPKDTGTVLHWFRSKDLRIHDNHALHHASSAAKSAGQPLICCYVNCEPELIWHGTSVARIDFILENLKLMLKDLAELNIPLVVLDASDRDEIVPTVLKFAKDNSISHLFANYEYEIDEIRRDISLIKKASSAFQVSLHHDQTIIEPGTVLSGSDKPMKVFTPYHKAWLATLRSSPSLLDLVPSPTKNTKSPSKTLFNTKVPSLPNSKAFESQTHESRIRKLWPAGYAAGISRMKSFIAKSLDKYGSTRSDPSKDSSSRMSPYFAAGVVSMREAVSLIRDHNENSTDFTESGAETNGIFMWIREIVFRELYRQTLLTTPHIAMNMPQNLKFDFVEWEDDEEGYKRWEDGTLGVPFVDAGMRQLKHEAYMHNRLRMNVSSYLYCNLLIDYRRGERYFMEQLIDGDLANNTQGWEPSYTVFNPVSQAERNDPEGNYIRKWVPELKDVEGKAVFDPFHRLSKTEFDKLGYPQPYVDWKETKQRCVERFKRDMKDAEP